MPRSKKGNPADKKEAAVFNKKYSVGIYARLSVEGDGRKNESLETQVEIAKAFMKNQRDMLLYDCYMDMGKSGTNFQRKAFERMMCDVRLGKINCIIVKDLSRFGRNHIETGNYIEKLFPFMGVRFIAVTDNFDSINMGGQNEDLRIQLKNLINEMYARDISAKIRSGRRLRWEQGSFMGGVPPYGYGVAWTGDKRCLFAEKTTSEIVRKIFELFLTGKSMKEITVWLYEQRIVRPSEYHKTGEIFGREGETLLQWPAGSVKMLLTNPVYMGCLVRGRTWGRDDGIRSRTDVGFDDCYIKENTHEAIISRDIFFEAAERLEKASTYGRQSRDSKTAPLKEDIFAEVLYCGECGSKMKRITAVKMLGSNSGVRSYSYNCPRHNRKDGEKCGSKSITLNTLTGIVKEAVRQEFSLSAMRPKELTEAGIMEADRQKEEWNKELCRLEKKLENIKKLGSEQYLKYRMGETEKKAYNREIFLKEREENTGKAASIQRMQADIAGRLRRLDAQTTQNDHFLRALVKGNEKTQLTGEVIRTLIHRIEVYPDRRVRLVFAFQRGSVVQQIR